MDNLKRIAPDLNAPSLSNQEDFERLFADWYGGLYHYAYSILKDATAAEEVVQSVFCALWERREKLKVNTSVKAYLFGSVYHGCVNWMRDMDSTRAFSFQVLRSQGEEMASHAASDVELGELERRLQQAMKELPDRCRAIFLLSRFSELSYKDIAIELDISVKTVEAQMSKALKHLRKRLAEFF
jgi:RNA polymerase sigma-70 factor (ECF subfamily)